MVAEREHMIHALQLLFQMFFPRSKETLEWNWRPGSAAAAGVTLAASCILPHLHENLRRLSEELILYVRLPPR